MFTLGSFTFTQPGASHFTLYFIVISIVESFCAHLYTGITSCRWKYFGFSHRINSSAFPLTAVVAFRTLKEKSTPAFSSLCDALMISSLKGQ